LESEDNHKIILLKAKAFVNDINQGRKVLIVLGELSDKYYNEMKTNSFRPNGRFGAFQRIDKFT
jgi:hypothetical protein